jgi:hypothetical protein
MPCDRRNRNERDDKCQSNPEASIHAQFILTQLNKNRKVESSMRSTASDWAGPIRILAALEQLWEFSTVVYGQFQLSDSVSTQYGLPVRERELPFPQCWPLACWKFSAHHLRSPRTVCYSLSV